MQNGDLNYRPLVSGISIKNARVDEPGTLGYIARDEAGAPWIVSAYHVLCNSSLLPYAGDEIIYQPAAVDPANRIATTRATRAQPDLDCAAAQLDAGIAVLNYHLGIGPTPAPIQPAAGMRVIKSGAVGGVTEGIIFSVSGDDVVIVADPTYPGEYVLSEPGDSGSLWVDQQTHSPIALHLGRTSARRASALSFTAALTALNLKPI